MWKSSYVAWQILYVCLEAFSRELIRIYVLDCVKEDINPSSNHFIWWRNERVVNPNFHFYYDLAFNIFLGFKCFRSGIRPNNSRFALAGRQKTAVLMFIGNHHIYKELIVSDMTIRVQAPEVVQNYIERNESFSRSGNEYRGEGGDYITENENRYLKSHLPPGVPTLQSWVIAARNHISLKENRQKLYERANTKDPSSEESSIFGFDNEIKMFQESIRVSGILEDPFSEIPLCALDGSNLHPDLVNFYIVADENYQKYKNDKNSDLAPVFVTNNDEVAYNDVNNWTIKKIIKETKSLIAQFSNDEADKYQSLFDTLKSRKKATYISFFEEIRHKLKTQSVGSLVIETNDADE